MFKPDFFNKLSHTLFSQLPHQVKETEAALSATFEAILSQAFNKLDLVTREEFDVQKKVLAKTRLKLEALEKKLTDQIKVTGG